MSGIYGYYIKNGNICEESRSYASPLIYWNRFYGKNDLQEYGSNQSWMIGVNIEHLSERYPAGDSVIKKENLYAVLDAVIYNREELMKELSIDACSDEDLLLEWILRKGYDALREVNGDFAGAIMEEEKNRLHIFRSHMGVRPLYIYDDDHILAFSTDMRGLMGLPSADLSINEKKFYLDMEGCSTLSLCETEFSNIHCARPASYVTYDLDTFHKVEKIYWQPGEKRYRCSSDEEYQKKLRELITDAIRRRLNVVTGMVGCELSGGLDSSVISMLVHRERKESCFYSWSYDPKEHPITDSDDERNIILEICKQEGIDCHFSNMRSGGYYPGMDFYREQTILPFMNTLPLHEGSAWMKEQGAKVIFTGHGGDEGVSHRGNMFELWYHREYLAFIRIIWKELEGYKLRSLRTIKRTYEKQKELKKKWFGSFHNGRATENFMNTAFLKAMEGTPKNSLSFAYDVIEYMNTGGSRNRLDNVAIYGAQNGVRYMVPFLDYRLVDFAVSIPREQYIRAEGKRYVYRKAFEDIIPESLKRCARKETVSNFSLPSDQAEEDRIHYRIWQDAVECLDWDYWKKYLDYEKIKEIAPTNEKDLDRLNQHEWLLEQLFLCAMLENAVKTCRDMDYDAYMK